MLISICCLRHAPFRRNDRVTVRLYDLSICMMRIVIHFKSNALLKFNNSIRTQFFNSIGGNMKVSRKSIFAMAFGLGIMSSGAQAAIEDLNTDNSSYSTAQYVGDLSAETLINVFGVRGSVSVFNTTITDDSNADFFSFDITSPALLKLNVFTTFGPTENNDPMVGLYDSNGVQLSYDDDGGVGYDSFLQYVISAPGTYIAAVTGYPDFDFIGGGSTDFLYTLQAEVTAVPVPAAIWMMGSSLLGLGFVGRKRNA